MPKAKKDHSAKFLKGYVDPLPAQSGRLILLGTFEGILQALLHYIASLS
jgi:hypothetical protein